VRDRASYVLEQNEIRLVVTSAVRSDSPINRHAFNHGDGVKDIALRVPDVKEAYREAVARGAAGVAEPQVMKDDFGQVELATIATYGDVVHTFVSRNGYERRVPPGLRLEGVGQRRRRRCRPARDRPHRRQRRARPHGAWVSFYEQVFGMTEMIHFSDDDISTEYSALMSKVMTDGQGKVKFPINEPAEGKRKSQIDEYLEFNEGPGAAHRDAVVEHREDGRGITASRRDVPHDTRRVLRGYNGSRRRHRRELGRFAAVEDPRRPGR
jgi:4-hydroxyphenylpyruvate dioxygenase and related hemolysins